VSTKVGQVHLIENQIGKLKHFRRVFSRFDKLAKNYLSFKHLNKSYRVE